MLAEQLEKQGYKVVQVNFENYGSKNLSEIIERLVWEIEKGWRIKVTDTSLAGIFLQIEQINDDKLILIVDEVEGINEEYFGSFFHSIRNASHNRMRHGLKSVILVGGANITGVIQDNAPIQNLFFATGKAEIQSSSYPALNRLANLINNNNLKIQIEGHTDNVGNDTANQQLSEQRAEAVKSYLITAGKVKGNTVTAMGFGESKPVADNSDEEGRAQNRRVEIRLMGN